MPVNDKNKKAFSYSCVDRSGRKFIYKNFNKSCSYKTNFSGTIFDETSFVGTKFKFCSFYEAQIRSCLLNGALFRKCNLTDALFEDSIISSSVFKECKIKNCKFYNCKIVCTSGLSKIISKRNLKNTEILTAFPSSNNYSKELLKAFDKLRNNRFIKNSSVLFQKRDAINTLSVDILVSEFGENFLVNNLSSLNHISCDFHTLSYIKKILYKKQKNDTINELGSIATQGSIS